MLNYYRERVLKLDFDNYKKLTNIGSLTKTNKQLELNKKIKPNV